MPRGLLPFVVRRAAAAAALVVVVSSGAMVLARLAPGDHLSGFEIDPDVAAAECERTRCQDPLVRQYAAWLSRAIQLDFGQSWRHGRPVRDLVRERAYNSLVLGATALALATVLGIPAGVLTGSRRRGILPAAIRTVSILLLSLPPLIAALGLLSLASRSGWFPVGALPEETLTPGERLRYFAVPVLSLALPIAATLERLQSRAMSESLAERCVLAAWSRGLSTSRIVWRHALKLSLKPVAGIYGILVGALISGSFAVEYVTAWPGLGALMYEALVARDAHLVAGCAAAGSIALAAGVFLADIALVAVDPRVREET